MSRLTITIAILMLMLISCGEKEKIIEVPAGCVPSPPRGIIATNHDDYVTICWYSNLEPNLTGYKVYWGVEVDVDEFEFTELITVPAESPEPDWYCVDDLGTQNGELYFYAVRAYNQFGFSDWSLIVEGTPRPEGSVQLHEHVNFPDESGFDFTTRDTLRYDDAGTDIYFSIATGISELITNPLREVDIQDYGYVDDWEIFDAFDLISWAPADGWAPSGRAEAITGHCYILRMDRDIGLDLYHYVKVFVTEVGPDFVKFRWAYQEDIGNRDLAPPSPGNTVDGRIIRVIENKIRNGEVGEKRSCKEGSTIPPIVQRG